jgi:putative Ig domain-containing protein/Big-like domain-containing protein/dockerin type I repeat protein
MSATKRVRLFVFPIILSFFLPLASWAAEADHTWSLTGSLAGPGSTNEINLAVENAVDIGDFGIDVFYGSAVLEPIDAKASRNFEKINRLAESGLSSYPSFPQDAPGAIRIGVLSTKTPPQVMVPGSGDILKFSFKVKEDAAVGDTATFYVVISKTTTVLASILLEVTEIPAPEFVDPGPQAANAGDTLDFTLAVADSTMTGLIFRMETSPDEAATLDSLTGQFLWATEVADSYTAVFSVTDGTMADTLTVALRVNTPPVFVTTEPQSVKIGGTIEFTLTATDADIDDELVYSLLESPGEGAELDSLTGAFSWVPGEIGDYTAKFGVSDGVALDSMEVAISALPLTTPLRVVSPADGATLSATEGKLFRIVFMISNTRDSLYMEALELPTGAEMINDTTLQWTPGGSDAGQYPVSVAFSNDDGGADTVDVTIVVQAVNAKPVWPVASDTLEVVEGEVLSNTFDAPVDEDLDDIVLVSAINLPAGATFDAGTLTLEWSPGFEDAGVYKIVLVATDLDGARGTQIVTLVVANANRAPQLLLTETLIEADEGEYISFTVGAFDPDGDKITVTAEGDSASWMFFDPIFSWTSAVEGEYTITFTVTDPDGLTDTHEIAISVAGVNEAPVFDLEENVSVDADNPVEIVINATDPDEDDLTYSLLTTGVDDILSRGASFSGVTFSWTPTATDIGPNVITFVVEDPDGLKDYLEVLITVTGRNIELPPEFDVSYYQAPILVEEGVEWSFDMQYALMDPTQDSLNFWAGDLPEGAEFDTATATITWTPGLLQAGLYEILCGVSDGNFPDRKTLFVEVTDTDVAPVLDPVGDLSVEEKKLLKVNLTGEDASGEQVSFDADNLPAGAEIFSKGLFKFHPDWDQAGTYTITFYVFDASGNSAEETVTLTVEDKNREPKLVVSNQSVTEGGYLGFTVVAVDPDGDVLSYAAYDLPDGASFNEQLFEWTPAQDQSGNYVVLFTADDGGENGMDSARVVITVGDVNRPPEIDEIGDQVVTEGSTLSLEITASDPDETDQLTISVAGVSEDMISLTYSPDNPVTATLVITPGYTDDGTYEVIVTAGDNNAQDPQSVDRRFKLEVMDQDVAPAFTGQLAGEEDLELTVDEGGLLEITVAAEDQGGDALSYSTSGLPRNASADFSGSSKMVSFSPDYKQSGLQQFNIIVSDGGLTVSKTVLVTVNEVNLPPTVFQIADQSVNAGDLITFAVDYSDPDGDSANSFVDNSRVPFLTQGDPAPASIRDGKAFIFDTALLPEDQQISSAVFYFWAEDVRGGVSDTVRVEIAVVRSDSAEIPELASGMEDDFTPPGFGLKAKFKNHSGGNLQWLFKFLEKSGFLFGTGMGMGGDAGIITLASADGEKTKTEPGVYTYLAADDLTSQFYGIRRGWGLDLSAQEPVDGADVEMVLQYFEEDLPLEIPNFTEERMSVFGYDAAQGIWVLIDNVVIDADSNTATFTVTDYSIVDYTVGAFLDVVAPEISGVTVGEGRFMVTATGVDTTYDVEGPYEFSVDISDDVGVTATLHYSIDDGEFQELELTASSGSLYLAEVAGPLAEGSSIKYYIVAQDEMNTVSFPAGAPTEVYELVVMEPAFVSGDVDVSGSINIFDLLELLQVLSGSKPATPASDVNGDNSTNIFDLLSLLGILAG